MTWQTEEEFESQEGILRAIYSTEGQDVYYILDASEAESDVFTEKSGQFYVLYWPNRNKDIETVSLVDSSRSLSVAKELLAEKTDESLVELDEEE